MLVLTSGQRYAHVNIDYLMALYEKAHRSSGGVSWMAPHEPPSEKWALRPAQRSRASWVLRPARDARSDVRVAFGI